MHRVLLGLAATAAIAAVSPAQGQNLAASSFSSSSGIRDIRFAEPPPPGYPRGFSFDRRNHRRDCRGEHCRHISVGDDVVAGGYGYGAGGYYDYGDYDGNRSFSPDKWNDWWHERPERAFPRWMSHNRDCARRWYSGDVLTC